MSNLFPNCLILHFIHSLFSSVFFIFHQIFLLFIISITLKPALQSYELLTDHICLATTYTSRSCQACSSMRTHLQAKRNVFKWSLKLLLDKQHRTRTVSQMWLISTRDLIYMHAKIKYNKTNAIKIKKKHTYTEAGIYKAAQRSVCPTEVKWNLGTHHHPPRHITFSYTSGSNEEQINKKMKATTYRNNSALGGSLLILSPRFCYCFSPLFFQFVKQLSVKFWDVNKVEHRQRFILLSIKFAQSPNWEHSV